MIKNSFLLLAVASQLPMMSTAFYVSVPQFKTKSSYRFATKNSEDNELAFPATDAPFDPVNIDIERAKDCAEHFGKCSTKEMEDLRDNLHKERLHSFFFGGAAGVPPEEAFQHRILEEELSLQLSLLDDATPPATMFPEATLTTSETVVHVEPSVGEKILMVEEAIVEENLGDALAICVVLGTLIAAPHLLQL